MRKVIYEKEDIIPIAILILDLANGYYAGIAFKFAVKDHFTDLKGLVTTDWLTTESLELLVSLNGKDKLIEKIGESVSLIKEATWSMINLYGVDYTKLIEDERLKDLAEEFYWSVIIDEFVEDGKKDHYNDLDYLNHLDLFSLTLVFVTSWLGSTVHEGEIDFERVYNPQDLGFDFLNLDFSGSENVAALQILLDLTTDLNHDYEDLRDYLLKTKYTC